METNSGMTKENAALLMAFTGEAKPIDNKVERKRLDLIANMRALQEPAERERKRLEGLARARKNKGGS